MRGFRAWGLCGRSLEDHDIQWVAEGRGLVGRLGEWEIESTSRVILLRRTER